MNVKCSKLHRTGLVGIGEAKAGSDLQDPLGQGLLIFLCAMDPSNFSACLFLPLILLMSHYIFNHKYKKVLVKKIRTVFLLLEGPGFSGLSFHAKTTFFKCPWLSGLPWLAFFLQAQCQDHKLTLWVRSKSGASPGLGEGGSMDKCLPGCLHKPGGKSTQSGLWSKRL